MYLIIFSGKKIRKDVGLDLITYEDLRFFVYILWRYFDEGAAKTYGLLTILRLIPGKYMNTRQKEFLDQVTPLLSKMFCDCKGTAMQLQIQTFSKPDFVGSNSTSLTTCNILNSCQEIIDKIAEFYENELLII